MLCSNPLLSQMPVAKKLFHSSSRVLLTIDCLLVPFIFNKKKARKKRGVYHQRHVLANLSHLHRLLILCYKKSIWRQKSALCAGSFSSSCCTENESYLGPEGHLLFSPGVCSSWFPASVISAQKKLWTMNLADWELVLGISREQGAGLLFLLFLKGERKAAWHPASDISDSKLSTWQQQLQKQLSGFSCANSCSLKDAAVGRECCHCISENN